MKPESVNAGIDGTDAIVQLFESSAGINLATVSKVFGQSLICRYQAICWAGCLTEWEAP